MPSPDYSTRSFPPWRAEAPLKARASTIPVTVEGVGHCLRLRHDTDIRCASICSRGMSEVTLWVSRMCWRAWTTRLSSFEAVMVALQWGSEPSDSNRAEAPSLPLIASWPVKRSAFTTTRRFGVPGARPRPDTALPDRRCTCGRETSGPRTPQGPAVAGTTQRPRDRQRPALSRGSDLHDRKPRPGPPHCPPVPIRPARHAG